MTRLCSAILLQVFSVAFSAAGLSLEDWGTLFKPNTACEVRWEASTNQLPKTVWVYKIVPSQFPPAVISNVMALGGYSLSNRTNIEGRPFSKDIFHFRSPDGVGYLTYAPKYGVIDYLDDTARAKMMEYAESVPGDSEATRLALNWVEKLGLNRSQLSTQPGSSELRTYKGIRERGRAGKKEPISRDVYFIRQVDGIDLAGIGNYGGVHIAFGDRGKVAELQLLWPNLERHKEHLVASASRVGEWIKQGRAVITGPNTATVLASAPQLKSLTVKKITPLYLGTSIMDEPKEFVHPFAELEVIANLGHTNLPVILNCPVAD